MIENKLVTPIFNDTKSAIVLPCDDNYAPYVSATILSIINSSHQTNNYDIIILNKDLSSNNKNLISRVLENKPNFSIRFYDVGSIMSKYVLKSYFSRITVDGYYRLLIPYLLKGYTKAVYLDCDIIVLEDIYELINIDLTGYLLAAAQEYYWNIDTSHTPECSIKKVGLVNRYQRFNSGVLLYNLETTQEYFPYEILLEDAMKNNYLAGDEDILNKYYNNKTYILHPMFNVWNRSFGMPTVQKYDSVQMYNKYLEAHKSPKIIHYMSRFKPWNYPSIEKSYYYWNTIRGTELYDLALNSQILNIQKNYPRRVATDILEKVL
ncbi:MAG: hypothetical protein BEN19_06735 [Epulopiscium sp. Nuni2H_MBin003]|nr:MAG: hypothetical protein BEN19_06735 [Epulopiscium sp. Nuni2H_MBin003]